MKKCLSLVVIAVVMQMGGIVSMGAASAGEAVLLAYGEYGGHIGPYSRETPRGKRTYKLRSDGVSGSLEIGEKDMNGNYPIAINTTNETSFNMCEFTGYCERTGNGLSCNVPEVSSVPYPRITIFETADGVLEVSSNFVEEGELCGMGVGISGRYIPKRHTYPLREAPVNTPNPHSQVD